MNKYIVIARYFDNYRNDRIGKSVVFNGKILDGEDAAKADVKAAAEKALATHQLNLEGKSWIKRFFTDRFPDCLVKANYAADGLSAVVYCKDASKVIVEAVKL